jgi:hypothetical protein
MRKSVREQNSAAAAKAKAVADLAEARRQRAFYADQEARLCVLAHENFDDEIMGDREEEIKTRRAPKKSSLEDGRASSKQATGSQYSSPARKSTTTHKRNQVSSPSAHYAPNVSTSPGTALEIYFEKGGVADQESFPEIPSTSIRSTTSIKAAGQKTISPHIQQTYKTSTMDDGTVRTWATTSSTMQAWKRNTFRHSHHAENADEDANSIRHIEDANVQESDMEDDEDALGNDACGTSPLAPGTIHGRLNQNGLFSSEHQASLIPYKEARVQHQTTRAQYQLNTRDGGDVMATSPPRAGRSNLRTSSFAPVILPFPSHANSVDDDPDFFEGASSPGSGPGPHFITVSFIKNGKDKIRDQLLSALTTTLTILSQNIPGVLVHCITKGTKLAPLDSASTIHFPTTGMGARNYMYIQNKWSLSPGTRSKLKLPAAKVGKDGRPLFDENRGYDGPDRINSVLWITCDTNAKDAIDELQMELEGEQLQIRWKPAQKKNTKNQIVIYGIPPVFDAEGIMGELLHGLKASEKELCDSGSSLLLEERIFRRDLPLPLFNGYFKQAIPPKAASHSEGQEMSLNKNKEYTQNGCRVFNLEFDPSDNARMAPVWNQFKESGRSELVLGRRSRVFVVPNAGKLAPAKVTEVRRLMGFHLKYTARTRTHSHPTVSCLDKLTEVTMDDPNSRPPRKFTSMRNEYMDLRTPDNHEVFHAVFPRSTIMGHETSVDCLYLVSNKAAREISLKIQVCPSAWWWGVFRHFRGYSESTSRSLLRNFELEASELADQSTFDVATMTVSTQFADTDDFLDRAEAELGFSDDESETDKEHHSTSIEISDDAKASLAETLLNKDNKIAASSHASAKSRRSTFSCSTGNDTNRSMNSAKFALTNKARALDLASERKKSAELVAIQRAMAQRIKELEDSIAGIPLTLTPGTTPLPHRRSVRISGQTVLTTGLIPVSSVGEVVCLDEGSVETEEADFSENEEKHRMLTRNSSDAPKSRINPSKTSHMAVSANSRVLDGID